MIQKILIALMVLITYQSYAQTQDLTIHTMHQIPQSQYSNPAYVPHSKFYIGSPVWSSFYFGFSQNALTAENIISYHVDDSLYVDVDKFIGSLHK